MKQKLEDVIVILKVTTILQKTLHMTRKQKKEWQYINLYIKEKIGRSIWVRPEKMFLEEIPDRPDNITGQKHRFEIVNEIKLDYTKK